MAIMIPASPDFGENADRSQEKAMFNALKNSLPDDHYVFYSQRVRLINNGTLRERELDFVVFHKDKGLLYIEAKNGHPYCEEGTWFNADRTPMAYNGPYNQASTGMYALVNKIKDDYGSDKIADRFKYCYAVWFWGYYQSSNLSIPDAACRKLTMYRDSNIQKKVDEIYSFAPMSKEKFTNGDFEWLFTHVLAPSVGASLLTIAKAQARQEEMAFEEMKREQVRLLDYLEEQPNAVINGCAGSGKTVLALEKAKRHAEYGEKTLFLCYNVKLKEYLEDKYKNDFIDFYNIDLWIAKNFDNDYSIALSTLDKCCENTALFSYEHVIVDEGQDFEDERAEILTFLRLVIERKNDNGEKASFYVFYDKNQLVQAKKCPEVITDADCKLTLYCNCRNTMNIARFLSAYLYTSNLKIKQTKDHLLEGDNPYIHFVQQDDDACAKVHEIVDAYRKKNRDVKTIQILTNIDIRSNQNVDTEKNSCLRNCIDKENREYFFSHNHERIPFTTSRKFKGLEADCVILVDINKEMLKSTKSITLQKSLLYVGASRAKTDLFMIVNMSEQECKELTFEAWEDEAPNAKRVIARHLACEIF